MKFAAAIILAVIACAQAHQFVAPLAYSYVQAPLLAKPVDGTYTERQFYPQYYSAPLYHAPLAYSAPYAYHAAAPIAYTAPVIAAAKLEPSYTAITRGAVHTAPLPGHSESTSAVNLDAAPGTA